MKQIVITIAIFIVLTVSVNAKSIVKDTDDFTISTNIEMVSTFEKSWTIEYDAEKSITVLKQDTKKGEEFIVRNEFFEVRYVNTENGFGVKRIKRNQSAVDAYITNNVISVDALVMQSKLAGKKLDEEKALSYIAGFAPLLLNENYMHLLN